MASVTGMSLLVFGNGTAPYLLAGFAVALTIILVRRRNWKKYANLPPKGPLEWPIVGSLPSLAGDELPHVILSKMAKKYGPIFSMQVGSFFAVVLSDYSVIRQAFAKSGDDFSDRPKIAMVDILAKGKGLIAAYFGSTQTEQRRFSLSTLRTLGMGKFKMEETISDEAECLAKAFASRKGQPFVPFHDIVVSVSNIICWLSLGKRYDYEDETFKGLLEKVFEIFELSEIAGVVNFLPFLRFLPGSSMARMQQLQIDCDNYLQSLVYTIRDERIPDSPRCFVDIYADHMQQVEKENPGAHTFTDYNMFRAVGDLFVAGTETTATTLKWALLYMITNREVQDKVHAELDKVIGRERVPSLVDRPTLPYIQATLLEIQRLATIVPLGVPHAPTFDTILNGYDIPAGTVILSNLWAVHHDPNLWEILTNFNPTGSSTLRPTALSKEMN